ncbi:uncharacterized protein LOC132699561 [Cylas formicarius]|uniref:uncharacterized protein LOC132699561 n=1 Tax=Cylas formicarius TaxID=197179 RepID=UPI0029587183|nr:uncharacterized protein LOC132699561 [Cylas formicarius]
MVALDIVGAYDNVNIPMLIKEMDKQGIPRDAIGLINRLLLNRNLFVKDAVGHLLVGPRSTSKGVPQGSPLAPLLFNIYVNSINDVNVLFAIGLMNKALVAVADWMHRFNLQLSPQKSSAILFSRSALVGLPDLVVNSVNIPWKNEIRYLGVTFDAKLTWVPQVGRMIHKAASGINIMRFLSRTWWGAHPSTLLIFYKAFVRSHLDYGSMVLGCCGKKTLSGLDRIQYQALRVTLGMMKSTPINILLGEACETSLEVRRIMLASKFLVKSLRIRNNPSFLATQRLYIAYQENHNFFRRKANLPLVGAFDYTATYHNIIDSGDVLACFNKDLAPKLTPINFVDSKIEKGVGLNETEFREFCSKMWTGEETFIFTDASKGPDDRVDFEVFIPSLNVRVGHGLNSAFCICSAEMVAISYALDLILDYNIKQAVIVSDSKSALQSFGCSAVEASNSYILLDIKAKIDILKRRLEGKISLCWIPSHSGIRHNETVDRIASEARLLDSLNLRPPFSEFIPIIRAKMWHIWAIKWREWGRSKGRLYSAVYKTPPTVPWFQKGDYNSVQNEE